MRAIILAVGFLLIPLVAVPFFVERAAALAPIGPTVEQICIETMQRGAPDLSWVSPHRDEWMRGRQMQTIEYGGLASSHNDLVRVTGILHADFEWVALYRSRADRLDFQRAPWVNLRSLWPDEPRLMWTKAPIVTDRCVVIEGVFRAERYGSFRGSIEQVLRLDVWSSPHWPFMPTPPPPPPPADPPV